MLGAAEADAFGAHFAGYFRVVRSIGIGAHAEAARFIGPFHQGVEGFGRFGTHQLDLSGVNRAVAAIERDPFALADGVAVGAHRFFGEVNIELLGADDAAFAPAARDHCGVAGLAARGRENSLRDVHSADVFRAGLVPDENHFLAARGPLFRFLRGEDRFADRRARHGIISGHEQAIGQFAARHLGIRARDRRDARCLRA